MVDPKGSGLLFFMFLRAQPYTCLGIECQQSGALVHKFRVVMINGEERQTTVPEHVERARASASC